MSPWCRSPENCRATGIHHGVRSSHGPIGGRDRPPHFCEKVRYRPGRMASTRCLTDNGKPFFNNTNYRILRKVSIKLYIFFEYTLRTVNDQPLFIFYLRPRITQPDRAIKDQMIALRFFIPTKIPRAFKLNRNFNRCVR